METFYLVGGNCERRKLDVQTIYNYLVQNGLKETCDASKADIILVYTCGAFNSSENRSIRTVKKLQKENNNAKIIVSGCLVKINPPIVRKLKNVVVLPQLELSKLDKIIDAKIKFNDVKDANIIEFDKSLVGNNIFKRAIKKYSLNWNNSVKNINYVNRNSEKQRNYVADKSKRFSIMISRGCYGNCSYCAIKKAHGNLKSKPINEVMKEFKFGLDKKNERFILLGEDIGCYGMDIGFSIIDLLKKIFATKQKFKIILMDFNAGWVIKYQKELIKLLKKNHKRIEGFMIPIQSGSDRILRKMRRPYKIDDVKKCLKEFRKEIPDLKIATHAMVGFPGETNKDFQETHNLIKSFKFDFVNVFQYQNRINTESYKMKSQISKRVIKKRALDLLELIYS
jgi:MiaB/RimO family radical SAM methylthiotransferase